MGREPLDAQRLDLEPDEELTDVDEGDLPELSDAEPDRWACLSDFESMCRGYRAA